MSNLAKKMDYLDRDQEPENSNEQSSEITLQEIERNLKIETPMFCVICEEEIDPLAHPDDEDALDWQVGNEGDEPVHKGCKEPSDYSDDLYDFYRSQEDQQEE